MRGRRVDMGSHMCAALYKKCEPIATKTLTAVSLTPRNRFDTVRPWPLLEDCRSPGPTWPTSFASAIKPVPSCCRSEEHTSELQSLRHLVCRLLLEKKILSYSKT